MSLKTGRGLPAFHPAFAASGAGFDAACRRRHVRHARQEPARCALRLFVEPLLEVWSLHELAIKAAPLILIGVGLSICYRSNNWNIGAEGQFTIGAITGSILPVLYPDWHSPLILPLMMVMGAIGGALYAGIPALLKTKFNTNEILVSLMLVYVAQLFLDWLTRGIWRDPGGYNFRRRNPSTTAPCCRKCWPRAGRIGVSCSPSSPPSHCGS